MIARHRASTALLVAAIAACVSAQSLPTAPPETVGLSAERLERIATAVQRAIDDNRIAGAVTLVARKGRVAWFKAQGSMDKEAGKPMRTDAIFRICSMTKPLTSAAVMMLYEEGRFLLDDPVSKYLPEFKDPKVLVKQASGPSYSIPAGANITIRHLLTHTSGLTYHWNADLGAQYRDAKVTHGLMPYDGTNADNVKAVAALPLLFKPGERFEYGVNTDVLGRLVEVISGQTLDEFFRARIFAPLKMNDTHFYVPEEKMSRLAAAYTWYEGKGLNRFPEKPIVEGALEYSATYPHSGSKKLFSGGGGLSSTAMDYARFCQMMLNGGKLDGVRVLGRKSVELMTHDQLGASGPRQGFGLGFGIEGVKTPLREVGSPGQYGWGGFFYTLFFIDPKEEMFGIFMGQLHPAGGLTLDRMFQTLASHSIVD
jgi:CubicO group peptidase (beta-lactamase class C family)